MRVTLWATSSPQCLMCQLLCHHFIRVVRSASSNSWELRLGNTRVVYGLFLLAIGCSSAVVLWCGGPPIHYRMCPSCRKFYLPGTVSYSNGCLVLGVIKLIALFGVGFPLLAFGAILIVPARSVPEEPCVREF